MPDIDSIPLNRDSLNLDFLEPGRGGSAMRPDRKPNSYKVVIADDEEEIHKMTKLVLKGFEQEGTRLQFYDTYSARETIEFLSLNTDVAIVLLDIVMEDDKAGFEVIRHLRETLRNNVTRVIVRTGQPGKAPEERVVVEYEVDDYKTKTELTVQKLYSMMVLCLRAHKNIKAMNRHRESLCKVINATQSLYKYHSFTEFLSGMLEQVIEMYGIESGAEGDVKRLIDGFAAIQMMDSVKVLAATGRHAGMVGKMLTPEVCPPALMDLIDGIGSGDEQEFIVRQEDLLVIYKRSSDKLIGNFVVLETPMNPENLDIIKLFLENFSLAIDNFMLNMNASETQNEIIFRISEVVENRCDATANHLRRVSNITQILAEKLNYNEEMASSIKMASVMHDVGKIGISDEILLKPAKLTPVEFTAIMKHTTIGYNILKDSKLMLLNMAANIALYHHERYDGLGYPMGKKGGEIPKECEIVAVADVFDALISKRCYKPKWPVADVIDYFRLNRGTQFAPDVVDALLGSIERVLEVVRKFND